MSDESADRLKRYHTGLFLIPSFSTLVTSQIFTIVLPLVAYEGGASLFEVGLVGGAANAVYVFSSAAMGRISKQKFFHVFILTSLTVLTVLSVVYTLVDNPLQLIALRLIEGVSFSMFWPVVQSGIGQLRRTESEKLFGTYNVSWSAGSAIGPLVATVISFFVAIRFSFWVTTLLLICTIMIAFLTTSRNVPETMGDIVVTSSTNNARPNPLGSKFSTDRRLVDVVPLLLFTALCSSSMGVLLSFFPSYARSLGLSITMVTLATFAFGASRFASYFVLSTNRIRRALLSPYLRQTKLYAGSVVICTASSLVILVGNRTILYFLLFIVVAAGFTAVYSITQSGIIAGANRSEAGSLAGLFESSMGSGLTLGPIAGGILNHFGLSAFFVPAIMLAIIVFFAMAKEIRKTRISTAGIPV